MALARARRSESGFNYWPGFVDALSTLVLSIVFLLSVFLVVQFFLSQEVTGKDKALEQLNATFGTFFDPKRVQSRRVTCGPRTLAGAPTGATSQK